MADALVVDGRSHDIAEMRADAQRIVDWHPPTNGGPWSTEKHRTHGLAVALVAALDALQASSPQPPVADAFIQWSAAGVCVACAAELATSGATTFGSCRHFAGCAHDWVSNLSMDCCRLCGSVRRSLEGEQPAGGPSGTAIEAPRLYGPDDPLRWTVTSGLPINVAVSAALSQALLDAIVHADCYCKPGDPTCQDWPDAKARWDAIHASVVASLARTAQ